MSYQYAGRVLFYFKNEQEYVDRMLMFFHKDHYP